MKVRRASRHQGGGEVCWGGGVPFPGTWPDSYPRPDCLLPSVFKRASLLASGGEKSHIFSSCRFCSFGRRNLTLWLRPQIHDRPASGVRHHTQVGNIFSCLFSFSVSVCVCRHSQVHTEARRGRQIPRADCGLPIRGGVAGWELEEGPLQEQQTL